jgi:competence protein ComQ
MNGFRSDLIDHIKQHLSSYKQNGRAEVDFLALKQLSKRGKLLNQELSGFSWGELYLTLSYFLKRRKLTKEDFERAFGIECIFLSADIVDDICDCDGPNLPIFQNEDRYLILISQYLLAKGFSYLRPIITSYEDNCLFSLIMESGSGEWQDLHFRFSINKRVIPTEEDYFKLIKQKSGKLTEIIAQAIDPSHVILKKITYYIGVAGQLRNDAADVLNDEKSDLRDLKAYLPFLKAYEYSCDTQDDFFHKLTDEEIMTSPLKRQLIREYIEQSGSIDYCHILSRFYYMKAFKLLEEHFKLSKTEMKYFKSLFLPRSQQHEQI